MPHDISDETLMAFADGVLDEPRFSQVAEAVEADNALAERLHALVEGASLAKTGYAQLLMPVPPELSANVRASIARADRKPFWVRMFTGLDWLGSSVALASVAIALIALPAGYLLGRASDTPSPLQMLEGPALAAALGQTLSGQTADLGNGVTMVPVASFADISGNLCREFETQGPAPYVAVACRLGTTWQTQLAIATGTTAQDYRPASSLAAIESYLTSIGATAPLLDAAEAEALGIGQ